jgi:hypothetical protein
MTIETGGTTLAPYDFVIGLVGDQVVINGTNGGNIRGKGGRKVKFSCGPGVTAFGITCTEFADNDGGTPEEAWPFKEPRPSGAVPVFEGTLNKPEKGAALLIFKYTISVDGQKAADPVIIVDH